VQTAMVFCINDYRYKRQKKRLEVLDTEDTKIMKLWTHAFLSNEPTEELNVAMGDIADEIDEVERSIRTHERDEG